MPSADKKPRTLYDKVFRDHVVNESQDGTVLLYIGTTDINAWLVRSTADRETQIDTLFTK